MKPVLKSPQSLIAVAVLLLPVLPTSVATSALAYQLGTADAPTLFPALALVAVVSITACCWLGNRLLALSSLPTEHRSNAAMRRPDSVNSAAIEVAARHPAESAGKRFIR